VSLPGTNGRVASRDQATQRHVANVAVRTTCKRPSGTNRKAVVDVRSWQPLAQGLVPVLVAGVGYLCFARQAEHGERRDGEQHDSSGHESRQNGAECGLGRGTRRLHDGTLRQPFHGDANVEKRTRKFRNARLD
jgi:hypothetical protein